MAFFSVPYQLLALVHGVHHSLVVVLSIKTRVISSSRTMDETMTTTQNYTKLTPSPNGSSILAFIQMMLKMESKLMTKETTFSAKKSRICKAKSWRTEQLSIRINWTLLNWLGRSNKSKHMQYTEVSTSRTSEATPLVPHKKKKKTSYRAPTINFSANVGSFPLPKWNFM